MMPRAVFGFIFQPQLSKTNPFKVLVRKDKKLTYVGSFPTAEQAQDEYYDKYLELYGVEPIFTHPADHKQADHPLFISDTLESVSDSENCQSIEFKDYAKSLDVTVNLLRVQLIDMGILREENDSPFKKWVDKGYFKSEESLAPILPLGKHYITNRLKQAEFI